MSTSSNDNGRGYEFACLHALYEELSKYRNCSIDKNLSYEAAKKAWDNLDLVIQETYKIIAKYIVNTIFELEPLIIEKCDDLLQLKLQPDSCGEKGDVQFTTS